MREIKFRAWDKRIGWWAKGPDLVIHCTGKLLNVPPNIVLQQWTGLKDRTGRDIYEGDIVLINHPYDRTGDFTNARGEVFWWEEEGGWYHSNGNGRPPKRMWEYVEVVGNIYEHPELLNATEQTS